MLKNKKPTNKTFSHEKIFSSKVASTKSPVNSNTFKQTYNAHKDQKFTEKITTPSQKIRVTNNFNSTVQSERKPIRTVFSGKTQSKVFDSRPQTHKARQQNTFKNSHMGDHSLSVIYS